jgi:hypothetical protein
MSDAVNTEAFNNDPKREMLRHALATVAYRGGKAIRDTNDSFAGFQACEGARSPGRLLAHIGDLMDWSLRLATGNREWRDSQPLPWEKEKERFFSALKTFDGFLASNEPLQTSPEKLLQGPIADALTHVGQLVMMRRMAGAPIKSESYYDAAIVAGSVSAEQAKPKFEF